MEYKFRALLRLALVFYTVNSENVSSSNLDKYQLLAASYRVSNFILTLFSINLYILSRQKYSLL